MKKRPNVKYYVLYEVRRCVGMCEWETSRVTRYLRGLTTEDKARKEARKWLIKMKKRETGKFRLLRARFATVEPIKL